MAYQYLVEEPNFPYCSGCGHTWINKSLDSALIKLAKKPTEINLITDIGCVGLVDKLFLTNTVHTTHGRSSAFATGLQIADQVLFDSETVHIVMLGDGGATIGLLHLVEAAKLNVNITVILHNNFVYGMTGGQNSGLTPEGFKTATTMDGNLVAPVHMAELLEAAQAGFMARKLATDKDLDEVMLEAINYPGFALVEVVELCTGYATKWNKMSKNDVQEILESMDSGNLGILVNNVAKKPYSEKYKSAFKQKDFKEDYKEIEVKFNSQIDNPLSVILAGSAGEGVQFASQIFLQAAVSRGLNVVQKNDNPVTIGTGFSMTELNISPDEILYSGIEEPDYIIVSSLDGFNRIKKVLSKIISSNGRMSTNIFADTSLEQEFRGFCKKNGKGLDSLKNLKFYPFRKVVKHPKSINFAFLGSMLSLINKEKELVNMDDFNFILSQSSKNSKPILEALKLGIDYQL